MNTEINNPTPSGRTKRTADRLSKDGKWRSISRVPHLLQYVSSGTYYARIKVRGKIIRESLATSVWSTAQSRLIDFLKEKRSDDRYRLAMTLEGILTTDYPAYLPIPRKLEENTFVWKESARDDTTAEAGGESNKFVGGALYFVKFGNRPRDPVWPVDIFLPQVSDAKIILGCLLADAENGFPIPFYRNEMAGRRGWTSQRRPSKCRRR